MRLFNCICIVMVTLIGCNRSPANLSRGLKTDTLVIIHRDTVFITQQPIPKESGRKIKTEVKVKEQLPAELPKQKAKTTVLNDTTFNYYVNKQISVKTTPWLNDERWILLYNLQGEETYRHKDIRKSYTVFAHLSFHPNGAVSQMQINENPGASRQWSETVITFSTINEPLSKHTELKPVEELLMPKPWEYWDNKTRQWKKQEVME